MKGHLPHAVPGPRGRAAGR